MLHRFLVRSRLAGRQCISVSAGILQRSGVHLKGRPSVPASLAVHPRSSRIHNHLEYPYFTDRMLHILWVTGIIVLLFGLAAMETTCYLPDGSVVDGDAPCLNNTLPSVCCGQGSTCLASGLCFDPNDEVFYRSSCTDQTWTSAACTRICASSNPGPPLPKPLKPPQDPYELIDGSLSSRHRAINSLRRRDVLLWLWNERVSVLR
jgi:hypothetical protein